MRGLLVWIGESALQSSARMTLAYRYRTGNDFRHQEVPFGRTPWEPSQRKPRNNSSDPAFIRVP